MELHPCAQYPLHAACCMSHNTHACTQLMHTSACGHTSHPGRLACLPPAATWMQSSIQTSLRCCSRASDRGDDHSCRHNFPHHTHTSLHPHADSGTRSVTHRASPRLSSSTILQRPCALTPLGGTFLREPGVTWLPLGQRKYPAHPLHHPLSWVVWVLGEEGGPPRAQSPGAKVLLAGAERKLHNLP